MLMFKPLVALLMLLVVAGCAAQTAVEQTPEELVGQRAQERRDALMAGDVEKAYSYLTPGYRASNSLRRYQARLGGAVNWTDASVRSVSCQEDACTVTVLLSYRVAVPRMEAYDSQRPIEESWVRVDGQWWHLPRR